MFAATDTITAVAFVVDTGPVAVRSPESMVRDMDIAVHLPDRLWPVERELDILAHKADKTAVKAGSMADCLEAYRAAVVVDSMVVAVAGY